MSDVRIEIEPNKSGLMAHFVRTEVADEIEALGLTVDGPEPALEQRFDIDPNKVLLVLLTLKLAATALSDLDTIVEIVSKWLRRLPPDAEQKIVVKLYGADGEVTREIERDDSKH
jgi:hypothetical protein